MWAYAVSFQLDARYDYTSLFEELRASPNWWNYLPNMWLIVTSESAGELWSRLGPHITEDDRALLIEVRNDSAGWLPQEAWQWINDNVPQP